MRKVIVIGAEVRSRLGERGEELRVPAAAGAEVVG